MIAVIKCYRYAMKQGQTRTTSTLTSATLKYAEITPFSEQHLSLLYALSLSSLYPTHHCNLPATAQSDREQADKAVYPSTFRINPPFPALKTSMSDRSGSPSDEGEGDVIRPHGDERDSSEESSDEDPEEARRIAEGFIQDEDDDDEDEEAARRRRRREKKKKRKRERERRMEEAELSEDELELLKENRGLAGPSQNRPFKRLKHRDGSVGDDEDPDDALPTLQDIFRDDELRAGLEDDDDDDLQDFIEEDEEEEAARGETEEQRKERKRAEKARRREAARARPEAAGMDRG